MTYIFKERLCQCGACDQRPFVPRCGRQKVHPECAARISAARIKARNKRVTAQRRAGTGPKKERGAPKATLDHTRTNRPKLCLRCYNMADSRPVTGCPAPRFDEKNPTKNLGGCGLPRGPAT